MVFTLLGLTSLFFPEKGISLSKYLTLHFASINDYLEPKESSKIELPKEIINEIKKNTFDSSLYYAYIDSVKNYQTSLQMNQVAKKELYKLFEQLESSNKNQFRIMHYGDSQIEGDRITKNFRENLQERFGGGGYGLISIVQVTKKRALSLNTSQNWKRYNGFLKRDSAIKHKKYGALISFSKYFLSPNYANTNNFNSTIDSLASCTIHILNYAYPHVSNYNIFKLFYGYESVDNTNKKTFNVYLSNSNHNIIHSFKGKNTEFGVLTHKYNKKGYRNFQLEFKGNSSPLFYAFSLESSKGVVVDNIPLRGSSGIFFTQQNKKILKKMLHILNPKIIILQYGGNAIIHMRNSKTRIERYVNKIKSQINIIKKILPKTMILFIGPSDMSEKVKTSYVSNSNIEPTINVLKKLIIENNCIYWDLYQVMGGKNSMVKWVNTTPALATKDYIHFTRVGANKVGQLLSEKFFDLYNAYLTSKQTNDTLILK